MQAELHMQSMFDITERWEAHIGKPIYFPYVWCKWSVLPATVGLIASLLSYPPGLACNEIEVFGWNDLSHPLCTHLNMWMGGSETKKLWKLLLNYKDNINRCWITLLISTKGSQLKAETLFLLFCHCLDMCLACKGGFSFFSLLPFHLEVPPTLIFFPPCLSWVCQWNIDSFQGWFRNCIHIEEFYTFWLNSTANVQADGWVCCSKYFHGGSPTHTFDYYTSLNNHICCRCQRSFVAESCQARF